MKIFMSITFLPICLFVLFISSCGGQSASVQPAINNRFVSGEGGFAINLPEKPTERKKEKFTILNYDVSGENIAWSEMADFFATVENYKVYSENPKISALEKTNILESHKKGFTEALTKAGIKYTETPFKFQQTSGYEIRGSSTSGKMVSRGFFVNNRMIILGVIKRTGESFDAQLELINSFRLLTKDERSAALIAENTPKDLPQTAAAPRALSDAQENNLKGKIKRIVEESQDSPKAAREPWSEDDYDVNGNLMKEISYFGAYPSDIIVWGWIDGMRVKNQSSVEYTSDEGPNEKGIMMITEAASPASGEPKKTDERFDSRYEYKYDEKNRVIEKKTFSNNGTLYLSEISTYAKDARDTTTRGSENSFINRLVQTLDASGNVVEELYYDWQNKPDAESTVYQYEFDTRGNWTIQKSFEKKTVKGKKSLKPQWVHYRKITYYD